MKLNKNFWYTLDPIRIFKVKHIIFTVIYYTIHVSDVVQYIMLQYSTIHPGVIKCTVL